MLQTIIRKATRALWRWHARDASLQAWGDVMAERVRQVDVEDYSAAHDDGHSGGELALVAALYAAPTELRALLISNNGTIVVRDPWPLGPIDDHRLKHDRRRRLVIAGALIVAEIERLDRLAACAACGGAAQ